MPSQLEQRSSPGGRGYLLQAFVRLSQLLEALPDFELKAIDKIAS